MGLMGAAVSQTAGVVYLVATGTEAGSIDPWVQGGTATFSIMALAYIVRKLTDGKLVSRDVADHEKDLIQAVEKAVDLGKRFADLLEKSHDREQSYLELLRDQAGFHRNIGGG